MLLLAGWSCCLLPRALVMESSPLTRLLVTLRLMPCLASSYPKYTHTTAQHMIRGTQSIDMKKSCCAYGVPVCLWCICVVCVVCVTSLAALMALLLASATFSVT